jgi:hypothetical protein
MRCTANSSGGSHFAEAGRLVTDNNAFFFPTNQETARILALFQAIARQP